MQDLFYKKFDGVIEDEAINGLLEDMRICYESGQAQNLIFFYKIYEFKTQRTDLGFSDLLLKNKQVVKKADLLYSIFGISKGTFSKICRVCERFIHLETRSDGLIPVWNDFIGQFNSSKIFEFLVLTDEQIKNAILFGILKPSMTLKQLRRQIKDILKGEKEIEEPKDTIPTEADEVPSAVKVNTQKYTAKDLSKFKKDEIIHMYLDLQMAYFKLKEKR